MAYSTINKSSDYMNTVLYTGDTSSSRSITGVGFQPDLVWVKTRNAANPHLLSDAVRGTNNNLQTDSNAAASTSYAQGWVSAFGADGYTAQAGSSGDNDINGNTNTYVAWNWKAGGSGSSNTDGSVTSTVSVNSTAGFSISKYTGTGSNLTFGHGLGAVPDWIMIKNLSVGQAWRVYHNKVTASDPYSKRLVISETGADSSNALGLSQDPSSSLIYIDNFTGCTNASGEDFICYAWIEKTGFSKFGSYSGNGSTDGIFIYTGFKPSFIMFKRTNSTSSWTMFDNKRSPFNETNKRLFADQNVADDTGGPIDTLSNGFKFRNSLGGGNASGYNYIYMAFGQPIISNSGICATAR